MIEKNPKYKIFKSIWYMPNLVYLYIYVHKGCQIQELKKLNGS